MIAMGYADVRRTAELEVLSETIIKEEWKRM
jgi:hypothetical protein